MDAGTPMWIALALGVAGVGVLRFAWGRPRRAWALNSLGWALLAAASVASAIADGAWGISVTALAAMAAASAALLVAAGSAPKAKASASARRVRMLPEAGEPLRILGRCATFAIVVVGGFAVSLGLGLALRWLGAALGWGEADANTIAFLVVPLAWSILAALLLMQEQRRTQLLTLLCASLPAWPVVLGGVAA